LRVFRAGALTEERLFPKSRPDEFVRELEHLSFMIERGAPETSPISLAHGVLVSEVMAQALRGGTGDEHLPRKAREREGA